MKTAPVMLLILVLGSIFLCCCPGNLDILFPDPKPVTITGEYQLIRGESGVLIGRPFSSGGHQIIIRPEVVQLGWNSGFILVKQQPNRASAASDANWFIIDVTNDKVYGPLSYEEFLRLRESLSIPSDIELLDIEAARKRAQDQTRADQ